MRTNEELLRGLIHYKLRIEKARSDREECPTCDSGWAKLDDICVASLPMSREFQVICLACMSWLKAEKLKPTIEDTANEFSYNGSRSKLDIIKEIETLLRELKNA